MTYLRIAKASEEGIMIVSCTFSVVVVVIGATSLHACCSFVMYLKILVGILEISDGEVCDAFGNVVGFLGKQYGEVCILSESFSCN